MALPTFSFVPSASPTAAVVNVDDIPKDVRDACEEVYATLKANPAGRIAVEFPTKGELAKFISQASAYCTNRPASLGGPIRFRKSPTRGLAETQMEFRIYDIPVEREAETDAIRTASAAAGNTAAKKATRGRK